MTETDHHANGQPEPPRERDGALRLILSMADTTWRMFTPPALTVAAGLYADIHWHTKPWLTLVSVPLGLTISVLLVKKQLESNE
jgi:hypothetical protein